MTCERCKKVMPGWVAARQDDPDERLQRAWRQSHAEAIANGGDVTRTGYYIVPCPLCNSAALDASLER